MSLKLRTKLLFGFIAVALIGVAIGLVGISNLLTLDAKDTYMYEKTTVPIGYLVDLTEDFLNIRVNLHRLFLAKTPEEKQELKDKIQEFSKNIDLTLEKYKTTWADDEDRIETEEFVKMKGEYLQVIGPLIKLIDENKLAEAELVLDNEGAKAAAAVKEKIDLITVKDVKSAKDTSDSNTQTTMTSLAILIATMSGGFLVSLFLALWLGVWVISRPLMKISNSLQSGSEQIAAASNQLSSTAQMISNGATEQASSVEETSSSMEELASMVRQNLANSRETSVLADKASTASQEGFTDMNKMVDSMKDIAKSSEQVGKVIKLIEDISFQTNILALNAAVEAARAGEAGMGFAVVADEVKNLANRSADAAKDTAQMIEDSIRKTEEGAAIANRLAEAFKSILANVQKVALMSKEVELSSSQQDTGINQVTQAIIQFDQVVQANASTAEESASSAEELSSQAASLMGIVTDLTRMVNGKTNQVSHELPTHRSSPPSTQTALKPVTSAAKPKVHSESFHLREVKPAAAIPFEDDEELKNT